MSFYEHYRLFVGELTKTIVEPAPAWPWSACRRCSVSEDPGWAEVTRHAPISLLGEHKFLESSKIRRTGMALWDAAVAAGVPAVRIGGRGTPRAEEVSPCMSVNSYYEDQMWKKVATGKSDDFIVRLDRIGLGKKILDLAHIRAHQQGDCGYRKSGWWSSYQATTYSFACAIAELTVAQAYDLPVDLNAENVLPYGIVAYPSLRLGYKGRRNPYLQVPTADSKKHVDRVGAYVCVSVEPGHDPVAILDGVDSKRHEKDWWSYQPKIGTVVGWDTPAGVLCRDLARPIRVGWESVYNKKSFTVPSSDLLPPPTLHDYLEEAREHWGALPDTYLPVSWWTYNRDEVVGVDRTPRLPCHSCVMFHPTVDGGLRAPAKWLVYSNETPKALKGQVEEQDHEKVLKAHRKALTKAFRTVIKEKQESSRCSRTEYQRESAVLRNSWEGRLRLERAKETRRRRR